MKLTHLQLQNFRNYTTLDWACESNTVVLLGKNGQGKTNLLEAIYLLSHAKSHRAQEEREMVGIQGREIGTRITAQVQTTEGLQHQLEIRMVPVAMPLSAHMASALKNPEEERVSSPLKTSFKTQIRVDQKLLKSRSHLLGHLPTVSFFSTDLLLLRGTPADRRRWLDAAASQWQPLHMEHVSAFQQIRIQRNRFLKEMALKPFDRELWQVLNQQFCEVSAQLIASRLSYLTRIADRIPYFHQIFTEGTDPPVATVYHPSGLACFPVQTGLEIPPVSFFYTSLMASLSTHEQEERHRKTSVLGPHRDDILFELSGLNATAYASQGQQRCIVLALKFSELDLLTHHLGSAPVLLLDDVMAELDLTRQGLLLKHLHHSGQIFLTTTHLEGSETMYDTGKIHETGLRHSRSPWLPFLLEDRSTSVYEVSQGSLLPCTVSDSLSIPLFSEAPSETCQEGLS